ncbi:hypothetical protein [Litorihabitans aurantiacus]|nr:hypothetical protein [Litorihabitans aurantiacus]
MIIGAAMVTVGGLLWVQPAAASAPVEMRAQGVGHGHTAAAQLDSRTPVRAGAEVQPLGVKSWVVKQALRGVAGLVRGGADAFVRVADDWLDDGARAALKNNSSEVADVIEDVANLPDLATHQVRSAVYNGLKDSLGHGTANVIANAVEGALWLVL